MIKLIICYIFIFVTQKDLPEETKKGRRLDFLDILLTARDEHGAGLTFKEIRDEVDTFLFEGMCTVINSYGVLTEFNQTFRTYKTSQSV